MFCPKCGGKLEEGQQYCAKCCTNASEIAEQPVATPAAEEPEVVEAVVVQPKLNTWLVPSILVTACCCLPFGIVGIIFASKASSALKVGNYEEASQNAAKAKMWTLIGLGIGIVTNAIAFIINFAAVFSQATAQ